MPIFAERPAFERSMRASQKPTDRIAANAPTGGERLAMQRVQRLLRWRGTAMGLAIGLSLVPFSFLVEHDRLAWAMLRDAPGAALGYGLAAIVAWAAYATLKRRIDLR